MSFTKICHHNDLGNAMMSLISKWKHESEEIRPNIFIPYANNEKAFARDVKIIFESIEANPIGKRLLEKIRHCSSNIYIIHTPVKDTTTWVEDLSYIKLGLIPPAIISITMADRECTSTAGERIPLPKHVILFHELTHAYHNISGKRAKSEISDPFVWESDEEYKTIIGFPSKKKKTTAKITENAFRSAEGLPERFGSWMPIDDLDSRTTLSSARVKFLGKLHHENQQHDSENASPPPVALCTINHLGTDSKCILRAIINGVDHNYIPKDQTTSFLCIDNSNILSSVMNEECYRTFTDLPDETRKILVHEFYPQLKGIDFKIKSLRILRISQEELGYIT